MAQQPLDFATSVLHWFREHGRHNLPWQRQDAYRVWLAEIMLQQTQVGTVIPFYQNFIERFPDITTLADAHIDQVLQYWQGLGYYARARNLHRAAQIIRDSHQGHFPQTMDVVLALPGVGRSTAGAVLSFAFGQRWPILDGNVKRVLARCFQVPGWYAQSATMQRLWQLTEMLTPVDSAADFNQAMMDIGATVCLRSKPQCEVCPLPRHCASYQQQTQAQYPQKKPNQAKPLRATLMLLHRHDEQILLWRRPPSGIWGGLWSLPEVDSTTAVDAWQQRFLALQKPPISIQDNLLRHQFSHYSLDISLATIELERLPEQILDSANYLWVDLDALADYGLPTPVRKLLLARARSKGSP